MTPNKWLNMTGTRDRDGRRQAMLQVSGSGQEISPRRIVNDVIEIGRSCLISWSQSVPTRGFEALTS
jgi:hypothetical protein